MTDATDIKDAIAKPRARRKDFLLGLFAIIGLLSSIITISSYFSQGKGAKLEVEIYSNQFRTPIYSGGALREGKEARIYAEGLRKADCDRLNEDKILASTYDSLEKDKVSFACKLAIDLEFAARWNGEHATNFSAMYEYNIKNSGDGVAREIRIKAGNLNSLEYKRGSDFYDLRKDSDGEFFHLPDLNPDESIYVLAWTNASNYQNPYWREETPPSVTYDGSKIHIEKMIPVSDGWYEIYDGYIKDSSPAFLVAVFVTISFGITFLVALLVSFAIHIYQGKPIRDFFKTTPSQATMDEAKDP